MQRVEEAAADGSLDILEKRIQHLAESAIQLADTLPSVSHALMRQAMCYLKDAKEFIPEDERLHLCFNCGAVRTYGINTKIRCKRSTARQRKKCRKAHAKQKSKDKGLVAKETHVISHKTVMVYECNLCNARTTLPGVSRTIPANNKRTVTHKK